MLRDAIRKGGRTGARWTAKAVFIGLLAVLVVVGAAANPFLGALAGVCAGLMLRSILPTDKMQSHLQRLWTGDAGEDMFDGTREVAGRLERRWRD